MIVEKKNLMPLLLAIIFSHILAIHFTHILVLVLEMCKCDRSCWQRTSRGSEFQGYYLRGLPQSVARLTNPFGPMPISEASEWVPIEVGLEYHGKATEMKSGMDSHHDREISCEGRVLCRVGFGT